MSFSVQATPRHGHSSSSHAAHSASNTHAIATSNIHVELHTPIYTQIAQGIVLADNVDWQAEQKKYTSTFHIPAHYEKHFTEVASEYTPYIALDNSGSMTRKAHPEMGLKSPTRWQEAHETMRNILDVGFLLFRKVTLYPFGPLDHSGNDTADVSPIVLKEPFDLQSIFSEEPDCGTPTLTRLKQIIKNHPITEKKALILVPTDGEPTDCTKDQLRAYLIYLQTDTRYKGRVAINFIMCTDDEKILAYYNEIIDGIAMTDVNDDYGTEKKEIEKNNPGIEFTRHAYWTKQYLFMFPDIDEQDRRKVHQKDGRAAPAQDLDRAYQGKADAQGCCVIM